MGSDFYPFKFQHEANKNYALYDGPWFILNQLQILQQVGNKIGKILTVDTCTSTTTRGRYARLCVQVPLNQPLKIHVFIGNHKQTILYESLNLLCIKCDRMGHNQRPCTYSHNEQGSTPTPTLNPTNTTNTQNSVDEWKTVQFPKKSSRGNNALKGTPPADMVDLQEQSTRHPRMDDTVFFTYC